MTQDQTSLFDNWQRLGAWLAEHSRELLVAGAVALGLALFLLGLRALGRRLVGSGRVSGWRAVVDGMLARTNLFFIAAAALKLVAMQADLPARAEQIINILFLAAAAFQVAVWTRALIIGAIEQRVGEGEEHRTLGTAMGLIRVLVSVAAFLIAIIVVLDNVGVNVTGLVAGLGIGGIAIGLAAQGIFSDLFAALAIIFDRPFRKGDTINVGGPPAGFVGTVENIGLKTTRLRALDGELVAFANAKLLENRVHNFALLHERRALMPFGIVYQTPPELIARIPDEVRAIIEAHEHARFDRCHAIAFAPSSIDFETVYHVESPDLLTFAQVRHEVMIDLLRRFAELDISFAYPTQTTFTAAPDGTLVMPWAPPIAR